MNRIVRIIRSLTAPGWIIAINAAVFVCIHIFGDWSKWLLNELTLPASPAALLGKPWAVVCYMFTQYAPMHLLANMLLLYFFSSLARHIDERMLRWQFWALYLSGGVAGALAFYMACGATGYQSAGLIGASASVMALISYTTFMMPRVTAPLIFFGHVELRVITLIIVLLSIIATGTSAIDIQGAHAGGFLLGIAGALYTKHRIRVMSAAYAGRPTPPPASESTTAAVESDAYADLSDEEILDILLDKIRRSGYNSLSARERADLNELSRRIEL